MYKRRQGGSFHTFDDLVRSVREVRMAGDPSHTVHCAEIVNPLPDGQHEHVRGEFR